MGSFPSANVLCLCLEGGEGGLPSFGQRWHRQPSLSPPPLHVVPESPLGRVSSTDEYQYSAYLVAPSKHARQQPWHGAG